MRKFLIVAAALAALAVPTGAMADVTGAARASEAATVVASVSDGDALTLQCTPDGEGYAATYNLGVQLS